MKQIIEEKVARNIIESIIDGASGRWPTITAARVNEGLYVAIVPGRKGGNIGKPSSWALIFVEPDTRGIFHFEKITKTNIVEENNIVSKHRGKKFAVDKFTELLIKRVWRIDILCRSKMLMI